MGTNQEQDIEKLKKLLDEIPILKTEKAFSAKHARWLTNACAFTSEIFGEGSTIFLTFSKLTWRRTDSFIVDPWIEGTMDYNQAIENIHHRFFLEQLDTAKGLLEAGIDQIEVYGIDAIYKSKDPTEESSEIIKILDLAENKLRKTFRDVPKNEKEVQDKFEDLLNIREVDSLREQEKIVYSSEDLPS